MESSTCSLKQENEWGGEKNQLDVLTNVTVLQPVFNQILFFLSFSIC